MRKLPRSVICIFGFIFLTTITYAQEQRSNKSKIDSIVQVKGASNSSILNKTKIPNFKKIEDYKNKVRTKGDRPTKRTSSGGMSKLPDQNFINLEINEDERQKGRAIGWATNSKDGVIIDFDGKKALLLKESEPDLYISKLISVRSQGELTLYYESLNTVPSELIITKFDIKNNKVAEPIRQEISNSNIFKKHTQKITLEKGVDKILINFKKDGIGRLILKNIKHSVTKNEN